MLLPISIAIGSVLAGALLGLGGRWRSHAGGSGERGPASGMWASALSTFALMSALAVVLARLLPDALAAIGASALVVFGLAAAAPIAVEKVAARLGRRHPGRFALELGYAALLVHQVADGVGLGTYGGAGHADHDHLDVLVAIAAHTVPVVALVTLAFHRASGTRATLLRVFGLVAATVLGVGFPALVPIALHDQVEPWLTAGVGGLLLHVVAHDWHPEEKPTHLGGRLIDLCAVAAGLGLVLTVGGHDHHGGGALRDSIAAALLDLSLATAPALLLGLGLGALLTTLGTRLPVRWLHGGGALRRALTGAIIGAPLPICACGVLPLAASLRRRGAGAALVVAFLVATPALGLETVAVTARLLGWPFALVRLGAAVVLGVMTALVVHGATQTSASDFEGGVLPDVPPASFGRRLVTSFDELLYHVAPWTVVGLVAAAYLHAVVPAGGLSALNGWGLEILLVGLLAIPSYACAAAATPLAAVLLLQGMSPGAVLLGLLLGPVTSLATMGFVKKSYGPRATALAVAALLLGAGGLAALVNTVVELPVRLAVTDPASPEDHGLWSFGAAALLVAALLRSIWRAGLRPWLASLGEPFTLSTEDYETHHHDHHHHDHDHRHDDHAHDDHAHEDHAHEDHAHDDHAHGPPRSAEPTPRA